MKANPILTITSLLSILFCTLHLSDDVARGLEPGGFNNLTAMIILIVWLYGTLVLAGRRSGYIIVLVGSLLACLLPLAHMRGAGFVGGRIANSSGVLLFVWTLFALGVTAPFSAVVAVRGLWLLRLGQADSSR